MDPRVKTPTEDLQQQHQASMICYDGVLKIASTQKLLRILRIKLKELSEKKLDDAKLIETITAMIDKANSIDSGDSPRRGGRRAKDDSTMATLSSISGQMGSLLGFFRKPM